MSGSNPNNAPSSSSNQGDRSDQPKYIIPYRPLPRLFVVKDPPDGPYDEVCITVCTQTINKRLNNFLPECKTYCIRKVFKHEMQALSKELDIGLPPRKGETEDKSLLFTERTVQVFNSDNNLQQSNLPVDVARTESGEGTAVTVQTHPSNVNRHEPFWREGYYLWYGKGRLAEHYKSEQMVRRLPEYENIRRQFEQTWSVAELERRKQAKETRPDQTESSSASGTALSGQQEGTTPPTTQENSAPPPQPRPRAQQRSFSDIQSENAAQRKDEEQSGISAWFQRKTQHVQPLMEPPPYRPTNNFPHSGTLVPIPPHPLIALRDEVYRRFQIAIGPTQRLYELIVDSYANGQQRRVREAVWTHLRGGGLDRFAEQLDVMMKEADKREEERKAKEAAESQSKSSNREDSGGQSDSV